MSQGVEQDRAARESSTSVSVPSKRSVSSRAVQALTRMLERDKEGIPASLPDLSGASASWALSFVHACMAPPSRSVQCLIPLGALELGWPVPDKVADVLHQVTFLAPTPWSHGSDHVRSLRAFRLSRRARCHFGRALMGDVHMGARLHSALRPGPEPARVPSSYARTLSTRAVRAAPCLPGPCFTARAHGPLSVVPMGPEAGFPLPPAWPGVSTPVRIQELREHR